MNEDSSQSPGEHRVVKAYLFDKRQGDIVEDWAGCLQHLGKSQVLWLDLQDPSRLHLRSHGRKLVLRDGEHDADRLSLRDDE